MRVLQVVTLISPDGAYGGPLAVAVNQSVALQRRGHRVELAATYRNYAAAPKNFRGLKAHTFRARRFVPVSGFAGWGSIRMLFWALRRLRNYDVVHVHLGRDLVTLPMALMAVVLGRRLVVQTHGMVVPTGHALAVILDPLLTRPVLRRASGVLVLTERERADVADVCPRSGPVQELRNGVPIPVLRSWPGPRVQLLFMARLPPRKRPVDFVRAALRLADGHPEAEFVIVGPDEGELAEISGYLARSSVGAQIRYEGAVSPADAAQCVAQCDVYVLPSVNEPFPMSVLEAMAAGKPVIVTRSNGLAGAVEGARAGIVVDEGLDALTSAMEAMLSDAGRRREMSQHARRLVENNFDIDDVAGDLESVYHRCGRKRL